MVDLVAPNNSDFVWVQDMSAWGALYPLLLGKLRMQMRDTAESVLVRYEWFTDKGNITLAQVKALGSIGFADNPKASETINIGGTTITFVTSGASGNQVNIGASLAGTLTNLLAFVNTSIDANISLCTYTSPGATLALTYKTTDPAGNFFPIGTTVTGGSTTAATLGGGGIIMSVTAPAADMEIFSGDYVYDLRFEYGTARDVLFGGKLTFNQGVTR